MTIFEDKEKGFNRAESSRASFSSIFPHSEGVNQQFDTKAFNIRSSPYMYNLSNCKIYNIY